MSYPEDYLRAAHAHCSNHRAEIEASQICGCFYCLETYPPSEIQDWIADVHGTAMCARCGIDSVIGDASGCPVAKPEFLDAMREMWFERSVTIPAPKRQSETDVVTSLFRRLFPKTN